MTVSVGREAVGHARPGDLRSASGRLMVAWQHPETRQISPVGVLDIDAGRYRFRYLRRAFSVRDFCPFVGFGDRGRVYVSDELFPLFQQRVMNPRRPDYGRYIKSLNLTADTTPWEQLAKSGGRRAGDTIQLFPEPVVRADGSSECSFLVHGVRHIQQGYNPVVGRQIEDLRKGDLLDLLPQPDNEMNPRALLISTLKGDLLGWVPDLLLDYVHALRETGSVELRVEHSNGVNTPYHFRLIARIEGRMPAGCKPFSGPGWEFVNETV